MLLVLDTGIEFLFAIVLVFPASLCSSVFCRSVSLTFVLCGLVIFLKSPVPCVVLSFASHLVNLTQSTCPYQLFSLVSLLHAHILSLFRTNMTCLVLFELSNHDNIILWCSYFD